MNVAEIYFQPDASNPLLAHWLSHCHRSPGEIAIRAGRERITHAGLYAAAASFAAALDRRGIGREDIVALATEPTIETIALMLAIAANGAAWLPIAPARPDLRLAEMIEEAQPALLIGDSSLRANLPVRGTWIGRGALVSPQRDVDVKASGTLAYVLFNMGLNGRTHGVAMRTHAAAALLDWHRAQPRLGKPARTLQFAAFDSETAFQEIFSTLATGGTLILAGAQERRDLSALLALLRRERVERAFLPSAVLEMLAAVVSRHRQALPTALLDVVTTGKQLLFTPQLRELFAALHQCVLHIQYGPTRGEQIGADELSGDMAAWPRTAPAGLVLPHARAQPGEGSGAWQRSSVAARTAALLRAARAAGGPQQHEQRHVS